MVGTHLCEHSFLRKVALLSCQQHEVAENGSLGVINRRVDNIVRYCTLSGFVAPGGL